MIVALTLGQAETVAVLIVAGLVVAALGAAQTGEPFGFGGVSDLWHVRDVAGVVMGPGRPEQSHQADEWVEEEQVLRAVDVYRDLAAAYLSAEQP